MCVVHKLVDGQYMIHNILMLTNMVAPEFQLIGNKILYKICIMQNYIEKIIWSKT